MPMPFLRTMADEGLYFANHRAFLQQQHSRVLFHFQRIISRVRVRNFCLRKLCLFR